MDEKELATFYENRRDDPSLWEERPTPANVRHRGTVVFSVRFDPHELTLLREKARERGTTVSELVRRAAIREVTNTSSVHVQVSLLGPIPTHGQPPAYTAVLGRETSPLRAFTFEPSTAREPNLALVAPH